MMISRILIKQFVKLHLYRRLSSQIVQSNVIYNSQKVADLIQKQADCLQVIDDYLTDDEYNNFLKEIDGYMKRKRYEYSHWDDAIHGYRESEKSEWTPENQQVLSRIRQFAFDDPTQTLVHVHVLDIAKDGYIKPHIDAIRYCGTTITGLSFLSSSIMRLVHKDDKTLIINVLLKPKSLYILKNLTRFDFTHEILKDQDSYFNHIHIPRNRRLSIICRNMPLDPSADMNPDTARQLFESGGILFVLDAPKEMEFGIDMYSWQIGTQFQGIKMIPPGIHYCYYSEKDLRTKELAHRQSFFIEIKQPNEMFIIIRWLSTENLFQRQQLTSDEYELRRNQRYELDRSLGQYPLDTYRQWLALSNHLHSNFIEKFVPLNGQICSANVFNVNEHQKSSEEFSVPKNLMEAESRLPKMTPHPEFALRWTMIENKKSSYSGSNLTQSKLDRTDELERILSERFDGNISGILCELQFSFLVFFLGQLYDGFEQWKCLFHFICLCQKAFRRWPKFYVEFLQMIYFQLKHFSNDSSTGEHFFVDIDQQNNSIYKGLENLFANISAFNDNEQMEGNDWEKLIERCEKMKRFLNETYQWTFDDEPEDEKPIIVELEN